MKVRILCLMTAVILMLSLLCGCGTKIKSSEHLEDYVRTLEYHDDFTILQLTDIHWSLGTQTGDSSYGSREYLDKIINEARSHAGHIDMIELTGDMFMLSDVKTVNSFLSYMESLGIPYAAVWGNHDRQGCYNPNWLSRRFENAEGSLYTEIGNDDVHERSNYVINLVDSKGKAVWQLIELDSGASYRESGTQLSLTYDYIRQDQLDWMSAEHKLAGDDVPALCYYHIAQADNDIAYDRIMAGESGYKYNFYKMETFAKSAYAGSTDEAFLANNVKGAFMGHAHADDFTFTTPSGIVYGLGVKTDHELYYGTVHKGDAESGPASDEDFDLIGASLVTLNDPEGDFTLEHLYLNERDGEDFVKWVTY